MTCDCSATHFGDPSLSTKHSMGFAAATPINWLKSNVGPDAQCFSPEFLKRQFDPLGNDNRMADTRHTPKSKPALAKQALRLPAFQLLWERHFPAVPTMSLIAPTTEVGAARWIDAMCQKRRLIPVRICSMGVALDFLRVTRTGRHARRMVAISSPHRSEVDQRQMLATAASASFAAARISAMCCSALIDLPLCASGVRSSKV